MIPFRLFILMDMTMHQHLFPLEELHAANATSLGTLMANDGKNVKVKQAINRTRLAAYPEGYL